MRAEIDFSGGGGRTFWYGNEIQIQINRCEEGAEKTERPEAEEKPKGWPQQCSGLPWKARPSRVDTRAATGLIRYPPARFFAARVSAHSE
jgi:hypothetical protein